MSLLDMFPEAAGAVQVGTRVLKVLEGMLNSTDIREKWKETGAVKVKFSVNDRYAVQISVADTEAQKRLAETVTAEVVEND